MRTLMKITKTIEVEGLGEQIKQARKADSRSITEICALVGMTAANWYRIEAEKQVLSEATLRKIESVLSVDLGVRFND